MAAAMRRTSQGHGWLPAQAQAQQTVSRKQKRPTEPEPSRKEGLRAAQSNKNILVVVLDDGSGNENDDSKERDTKSSQEQLNASQPESRNRTSDGAAGAAGDIGADDMPLSQRSFSLHQRSSSLLRLTSQETDIVHFFQSCEYAKGDLSGLAAFAALPPERVGGCGCLCVSLCCVSLFSCACSDFCEYVSKAGRQTARRYC
jgi:hypothetical protein